MNSLARQGLAVDGLWGRRSQAAFVSIDSKVREVIETKVSETHGVSVGAIAASYAAKSTQARANSSSWIPSTDAEALASRAAELVGIPADAFVSFLRLEPSIRIVNGVTYYDTRSKNGSFRGLFQMGVPAWETAARWAARSRGRRVNLPPLRSYDFVWDAWENTYAAALLASANIATLMRSRPSFRIDGAVLYAMHNQGPTGYVRLVEGAGVVGKQSVSANRLLASAIRLNKRTDAGRSSA
jgi:hypothetical protein